MHNFIHQRLVNELGSEVTKGSSFGVTIGDRTMREGHGVCKRVEVKLLKLTVIADFLAIELGRMDVILGSSGCVRRASWGCTGQQ